MSINSALAPFQDVLSAEPSDDGARQSLINELKRRAKHALASMKRPMIARELYAKAIEVGKAMDSFDGLHLLLGNRAMCDITLGNYDSAVGDAKEAIEIDGVRRRAAIEQRASSLTTNKLND